MSFDRHVRGALESLVERVCGQIEAEVQDVVGTLTAGNRRRRHAAADLRLVAEEQLTESFAQGLSEVRGQERQAGLAALVRLLASIRALDACASLSQLLDVLVVCAGREAGRAVLLLVRGNRLQGWRAAGFSEYRSPEDGRRLDVLLDESQVLAQAIRARQAVATGPGAPPPPFILISDERAGLALPIDVGGEVVAVMYADTMGEPPGAAPGAWPELLEVLTRHAARCLERLTLAGLVRANRGKRAGTAGPDLSDRLYRRPGPPAYRSSQERPASAD
jgi:hypothetical protein